jgi:hypothetical protein
MTASHKHRIRLIGRREFVALPALGLTGIEAKVDTGAFTSSLHVETISLDENDSVLCFSILQKGELLNFRYKDFDRKKIKNSFGEMEERYVIKTVINMGGKNVRTIISLSNRDNMRYPMLIGRRLLKGKFLIDVKRLHTGGIALKQVLKIYKTYHTE